MCAARVPGIGADFKDEKTAEISLPFSVWQHDCALRFSNVYEAFVQIRGASALLIFGTENGTASAPAFDIRFSARPHSQPYTQMQPPIDGLPEGRGCLAVV